MADDEAVGAAIEALERAVVAKTMTDVRYFTNKALSLLRRATDASELQRTDKA